MGRSRSPKDQTTMKILLAVDGSAYTKRVLDYLSTHKELLSGQHQFTAITVVQPITQHAAHYLDKSVIDSYYNDTAKEVLDPVVAHAGQQGWNLSTLHPVGHAGDAIAEAAAAGKYDLVVMGSHGHSNVANLLLGSTVARVLARSKAPVLIVR
jgi:nucleotide-binding universal stress UspA family protein